MLFKIMFGYCPEIEGTETVETKIYFFKKNKNKDIKIKINRL
jgi:Fe-S-cluster containining protein